MGGLYSSSNLPSHDADQGRDGVRIGRVRVMLCKRESLRGVEAALSVNHGEGLQHTYSSVSCGVKRAISFTGANISEPENAAHRQLSYPSSASPSTTTIHPDTGSLEEEAGVYSLL